jgi:hypothetical protein
MTEFTGCVMAIDPSGRGKDETGYAIVKILHGNLFLCASGGFRDGYAETTLASLASLAKLHRVNFIRVEANFGDGMFSQLLKPALSKANYPVTIEEERSTGQKEARIADVLEPVLSSHRLVVDEAVIRADADAEAKYQLFYQLTRLTRDRGALPHDDRLDALAMAVGYWVEHMARDTEKAADDHREALQDMELRRFAEGILGAKAGAGDCWFDLQ